MSTFWTQTTASMLALLTALSSLTAISPARAKSVQAAPQSSSKVTNADFEFLDSLSIADTAQKVNAYRLKSNGLTVLLCERHMTPVITTQIVYRVGSRNEAVGYTGSTHFLEHLMFKGTTRHDPLKGTGLDDTLKPVGGFNNATTSYDRTSYFEITPANQLNVCLELEADRMRNLLLRKSDRDAEMTVVRNELERADDDPQELLQTNLFASAYKEHPYHHPVIGWRSDVENVPLSRLRAFYDQFYWPNNATLILIGDFNSKTALREVAKLFGGIKRSPAPFPNVYTTEPPQEGERRFIVKRGSGLPRVVIGYHIPKCDHKDTYAMDVIESILGDEAKKASRLYKRFVDGGLVSEISAGAYEMRDPGMFTLSATPSAGLTPEKIEALLQEELLKLKREPVTTSELDRAKKSLVKQLKLMCSDPMGLADQLTEAIAAADWRWLSTYASGINKVTKEDIKRVASKYFDTLNCTVGYYLPKEESKVTEQVAVKEPGKPEESSSSPAASGEPTTATDIKTDSGPGGNTETQTNAAAADEHADLASAGSNARKDTLPEPVSTAAAPPPKMIPTAPALKGKFAQQTKKVVLANGLTVLIMPVSGSGTVAVSARSRAGAYFRDMNKTAVPDMVADALTKGSKHLSKEQLAEALENLGASMNFNTDNFWMGFNTEVASEDFSAFIPLAAETMQNPLFPDDELARAIKLKVASLKQRMDDTGELAWNAFCLATYKPGSVYWNKTFDKQIKETETITSNDLRSFHAAQMTPANTVFAIVGDITVDKAVAVMQKNFSAWSGKAATPIKLSSDIVLAQPGTNVKVPLADKSNADAIVGHPIPVGEQSTDFCSTLLANAALGFDSFSTRLAPVRDKYGLSYAISSSFQDEFPYSPWTVSFSVNPKNYHRTLKLVRDIVGQYVKEGISERELEHEKSHLKGAYFVGLRGPRQIAGKLSEYVAAGLGPEFIDNFGKNIDAVTINSANTAIRKYFNLEKATTVVCGTMTQKK